MSQVSVRFSHVDKPGKGDLERERIASPTSNREHTKLRMHRKARPGSSPILPNLPSHPSTCTIPTEQ